MARKKSKSTKAKIAFNRLLNDEQVQKQLSTGAVRLREAYSRASGRPASKAIADKKVYAKVQEAASSFTSAGRRLRRKPEPAKRTGRKLAIGAAVAGVVAFVAKKKRGSDEAQFEPVAPTAAPSGPVPAPTPPTPVSAA